jgi:hypothetical protein
MKYAVKMDSGSMIHITKFHDDRFRRSKFVTGDLHIFLLLPFGA